MNELLLIAGLDDPVLADLVAHLRQSGKPRLAVVSSPDVCCQVGERALCYPANRFSKSSFLADHAGQPLAALIVFLPSRLGPHEQGLLDALADLARDTEVRRICIVSTFTIHFGSSRAAEIEDYLLSRLPTTGTSIAVFRPGPVLSPHSPARRFLSTFSFFHPLVPAQLTGCTLDGAELFAALEEELSSSSSRPCRTFTLLGPNRPWKEVLRESQSDTWHSRALTLAACLLALLLVGQVLALLSALVRRAVPRLRAWCFDTLVPPSIPELLALYNRYSFRDLRVVGYNNGVVHFGQRHPGKTVLSTVGCNKVARVRGSQATFDSGVTLRQAVDVLAQAGKELHVLPNYSYVSVGTSFFIPIHGSASEYSTLGDTIDRVVYYDPLEDRLMAASRTDPAFRQLLYNLKRDVLLLRLTLRIKERSRYYMKRQTLENPTSQQLLAALQDDRPSNVEIRKSKASSSTVELYTYYTQPSPGDAETLEFPRDSVGRLWDRLETNPIYSALFHGLMRRFGYHVELFFTAEEFAVFWKTHGSMPIAKIQLRYIRCDGFPCSPFRDHDCISADLFLLRRNRQKFETYVQTTFSQVQLNPGKHSM